MERTLLGKYRDRLLELRRRLARDAESTKEALRQDVVTPGDISTVPTHPADQDAEGLDEQIAIAQNEEYLLEEVESALARIEAGTFGSCQQCGRQIARERLEAVPYASMCIDCARQNDDQSQAEPPVRGEPRRFL